MIRYTAAVVLLLHGLIHTMGFLVAFRLAALPLQLTPIWLQPVYWTRPVGSLWLLAGFGFATSAVMLLLSRTSWWLPGALALPLSQLLILLAWQDAKAGTWLNVVLALPLAIGAAHTAFERETRRAVAELHSGLPTVPSAPIQAEEVERLPQPVAHWLAAAGVVGRARTRSVWLQQSARLRTEPGGNWMPCSAEQHFRIDRPGFIWSVRARMLGAIPIDGRDSYMNGHGRMLIKPLSLLTVVDAADARVDQGTLLRYLGELVWFPSGALEPYIQWEAVASNIARATMSYAGTTASATFEFAEDGRVMRVSAERYMGSGSDAKLRPWTIPFRAWRKLDGVVVPVEGDVIWQLESGPFAYYDFTLKALRYDSGQRQATDNQAPLPRLAQQL
ncbi:MAG TPA: DUF6544 family protein [Polyangiales bacterium]|nr:DUF6544 family protein [Polyangiales bacterium]